MSISANDFNDGMARLRKAFRCANEPELEEMYWEHVKAWSLPVWAYVVTQLIATHKYRNLPLVAQLDECRQTFQKESTKAEWFSKPSDGTPLCRMTVEGGTKFLQRIGARAEDPTVEYSCKQADFLFESQWKAMLAKHGREPKMEEFFSSKCNCLWCEEHGRGIYA